MNNRLLEKVKSSIDIDRLTALALTLVKRPSQQTNKLEYDPEVKNFISELLVNQLSSSGIKNLKLDNMGNLICRIGNPESRKKVFYLGYAMTHPASSMADPFKGEIISVEGKKVIRGRGVSEQKGALAAMIATAEFLNNHEDELDGEFIFAVSLAGETGRHDSIDSIRKELDLKADFGVVGIGTKSKICQGNKGRVDILINVYGKSCHSSVPSEGINAIEGACKVIEKLENLAISSEHPNLGKATLTSTSIKSYPDATHTIQNECRLVFDRRLLPGDDVGQVVDEVRKAIGAMMPFEIEVKQGPVTFPSEVLNDSIIIKKLSEAIDCATEEKAQIYYSNAAIDAGYLNKYNVPSVMFGPGNMDYWHTDNEILSIEDLVKATHTYTYLAYQHLLP